MKQSTGSTGALGLGRLRAWHLNDSCRECGSRVDRHAGIGAGLMGLEPFRHLVNDLTVPGLADDSGNTQGDRKGGEPRRPQLEDSPQARATLSVCSQGWLVRGIDRPETFRRGVRFV